MDDRNRTIDPRCLAEPPNAVDVINELDVFGIVLYTILTFMATVSLLLYLEECVYVYKNVSYPKKTTIIWVSGAAPVIATMSCLGMWIPRSTMFTDMTSNSYFAVVIYKVLILMLEECGGDDAFLSYSSKKTFRISTGPCCCCCPCLPRVPITRRMLFLLKLGSLQYAIMKPLLSVFSVVLWTNGIFDLSDLVLVLSQLQSSIINILSLDGTIACSPPFSSIARGSMLSQQLMIVEMFIITLVTWMLYRRPYEPVKLEPTKDSENNLVVKLSLNPASDGEYAV
ncbi:Organic solute transporter subunit alpha [Bagarius yarrelli]|uniref:Organic solute transporter subunit alpha n=1 Tax=Bagarius yarrelli TaxID=175774 RepID=A0A556TXE7_BAGYA|nr:Organic solute transporter subunit alpha [Bagarius yarrelli]